MHGSASSDARQRCLAPTGWGAKPFQVEGGLLQRAKALNRFA